MPAAWIQRRSGCGTTPFGGWIRSAGTLKKGTGTDGKSRHGHVLFFLHLDREGRSDDTAQRGTSSCSAESRARLHAVSIRVQIVFDIAFFQTWPRS